MALSLHLYHWKGNNRRVLLAGSTPNLPVYTGNYTIISSRSWTHIIMGVYYFSPTTSASNSRQLDLTKPARYGNSQLCWNIKEVGHASSSCILKQNTHMLQHLWLGLLTTKPAVLHKYTQKDFVTCTSRLKTGNAQTKLLPPEQL